MSSKKHQIWAMMPLLGILLMSPQDLQSRHGRHIASDVEDPTPAPSSEVVVAPAEPAAPATPAEPVAPAEPAAPAAQVAEASKTPKVDLLIPTLTVPARQNPVNLNGDMLKEEITSLLSRVDTAEEYESASATSAQIEAHRSAVSASLISLLQVEKSLPDLLNPADADELRARIAEAKIKLEASLVDLEANQVALAARPAAPATPAEPAAPAAPAAPSAPSVATTETTSAERAPSVVASETRPDPEATKDPILCALEEQNKLLREQLQTFMNQQTQIAQQLLSMTQMMMMQSMQNMYRTPDTFNPQQAYQYHQPQVAGNWVYYPNGLQPIQPGQTAPGQNMQSNIFGLNQPQPQQPQQPSAQVPFAPPQMMNPGGQWGLAPMQLNPGTFGLDSMSFNFSQGAPQVPLAMTPGQFI